jgi:hypothetical protein
MEVIMQGAGFGDDGELVFFPGETDQRSFKNSMLGGFQLDRMTDKLMRSEAQIQA